MKKLLCTLLALVMVIGSMFVLVACGDSDDSKKKNDDDEKNETVIPEGYIEYNNGKISFAYPENWKKTPGSVDTLVNESGVGNNITVSYEEGSDIYSEMDIASFNKTLKPIFESFGMTVTNASVEQLKNGNNVKVTKIKYDAKVATTSMTQTMLVVAVDDLNYIVTVTETEAQPELAQNAYNTLKIVE